MTAENPTPASAIPEIARGAIVPDSSQLTPDSNPATEPQPNPITPPQLNRQILANPLEPALNVVDRSPHQLPYDPFNPEINAARARILSEPEPDKQPSAEKFSATRILSEFQARRKYNQYVKEYTTVLLIRGTPQEGIEKFRIQAQSRYKRASAYARKDMEMNMKRNLELLLEDAFDTDLTIVADLMTDNGKSPDAVGRFKEETKAEFKPTKRKEKIALLRGLETQREEYLIANYKIYLGIWNDLNHDGVNIEAMRAAFENAHNNRGQQAGLAEKLYAEVSNGISQRALAYAAQWRQLSIDQGMPSDMANEDANLLVSDATKGPLSARVNKMREIKGMTEELLFRTFGITSELYGKMVTGGKEAQYDLDAAFNDPNMTIENRIKFAKGMYRKVDRIMRGQKSRLLAQLAKQLKREYHKAEVRFRIHETEALISSLPRINQYDFIATRLASMGLTFEPIPVMVKS